MNKSRLWTGRILFGLVLAFLLMDSVMKIIQAQPAIEATIQLGYPASVVLPLGIILLISTALYAIPRTSIIGAILLTGYLGGAVATHVRVGNPIFSHVLFPVYLGAMIWGALALHGKFHLLHRSTKD